MIDQITQDKIKRIVQEYKGETLIAIAKKNGISVFNSDFSDLENGDKISGVILYKSETDKFSILINENDINTRKRFTLAHELGHYFLHQDFLKSENYIIDENSVMYRRSTDMNNILEQQANAFAAEILMPEDLVRYARKKLQSTDELADIFDVSLLAMSFRLVNLGLKI